MRALILILLVSFILAPVCFSQDSTYNERIGPYETLKSGVNYYNYADPDKVNIEVSLWGYVRNPGRYLVPKGTTAIDLITLGGGPETEALLEDVRIVRLQNDTLNISKDQIILLNYNDFLWEEQIQTGRKNNPVLLPGDMMLLPGEPRYFFRENLAIILSIATALISVGILVLNITTK